MKPLTFLESDETQYDVIKRQLLACLEPAPEGREWADMKNSHGNDRPAAVLVPLIWYNSDWHILMTKRAAHLSHHAGQISFPGGAFDACDGGLIDTALREAYEEIRLEPTSVRVMGGLLPVRSPAGFVVQPIVGIVGGDNFVELRPNPDEVDTIFTLPLAHINEPGNFSLVPRQTDGRDNSYWVVSHPEHHIWGLSAWVLNDLRQRLFHGQTLP